MKNLNSIASDLFNKIRGRFQDVTIGNKNGQVTNVPEDARYFDFSFQNNGVDLGKVSVSLDEDEGIVVVVGRDIVQNQEQDIQDRWFNFLKELRVFAKKRLLNFDVRDINKSNLNKRDYEFLAANRTGEKTMAETKMYGTNKTSFQKIGNARLVIKHQAPINMESTSGRTQKINAIFIESPAGERFRYPYKHLSGARAMAMHVSEGGHAYDDFGKYISGLSEEMTKLRKFNQYMNRSAVMAEGLKDYSGVVKERVAIVKKEIQNLQKPSYYAEALASYVVPMVEDVPEDVAENWIDQLTIKQFNEELKDVFPYIYSLVGEATKAKELGPEDLEETIHNGLCFECGKPHYTTLPEEKQKGVDGKVCWKGYKRMGTKMKGGKRVDNCVKVGEAAVNENLRPGRDFDVASKEYNGYVLGGYDDSDDDRRATEWGVYKAIGDGTYKQVSSVKDPKSNGKYPVSSFSNNVPYEEFKWTVDNMLSKAPEGIELEAAIDSLMGQFAKNTVDEGIGSLLKNIAGSVKNAFKPGVAITPGSVKQAEYILQKVLQGGFDGLNNRERQFMTNFSDATLKGLQAQAAEGEDKISKDKPTDMDVQIGPDGSIGKADAEPEKEQTPIGEYILSYFDRETGKFPKGETAVLTAVQKEYGDESVKPAAQFMKQIETVVAQKQASEMAQSRYPETEMIKRLAGV